MPRYCCKYVWQRESFGVFAGEFIFSIPRVLVLRSSSVSLIFFSTF